MNIKPIRTEDDYEDALERIMQIMDADFGSPEGDELDVLVTLVEAYESKMISTVVEIETKDSLCTRVTKFFNKFRIVHCYINGHDVINVVKGPYQGRGDSNDRFGICNCCKQQCHRDTHWTSDNKWRVNQK